MFGVFGFVIMLSIIVIGFILYVYKLSEKIDKIEMHAQSLDKLETKIKELNDGTK